MKTIDQKLTEVGFCNITQKLHTFSIHNTSGLVSDQPSVHTDKSFPNCIISNRN